VAVYRNFYIGFWDDDDMLELSADERYVYLYLITHPKGTMCGIFEFSMKLAEFHLKINVQRIAKALEALVKYGKIVYDASTKEVCIVNFMRHNFIDSPNTRKSLEAGIKSVKSANLCDAIRGLAAPLRGFVGACKPPVTVTESLSSFVLKDDIKGEEDISEDKEDIYIGDDMKKDKKFVKPTETEVNAYCEERKNGIDATAFVAFYESKGWVVGKSPMKDWKAAVRTWEQSHKKESETIQTKDGKKPNAKIDWIDNYMKNIE